MDKQLCEVMSRTSRKIFKDACARARKEIEQQSERLERWRAQLDYLQSECGHPDFAPSSIENSCPDCGKVLKS